MSFIQFENVYKRYKMGEVFINANNGISFDVEKGEFVTIIGQSGAGKTTLLNLLGGMDSCDEGLIRVGDEIISDYSNKELTIYRREDIGFVFQFYNLVPNLTALENVELATQICSHPLNPEEVLCDVGLSDRTRNFPAQLSGGEQQRVSIARALAKAPKILLCDEPTGALDDETGKNILMLLKNSGKKTETTVIIVTHNHSLTPIADRVITVKDGKIVSSEFNPNPKPVEALTW